MPAPEVNINVLLDPAQFDDAVQRLQDAGVTIDRRHSQIGMVSGRADSGSLPALKRIDGVLEVETERRFSLPDPGSDLQ